MQVDTSDEWIRTRTGIAQRHIAGPDDSAASMGEAAARAALDYAGVDAETVMPSSSPPPRRTSLSPLSRHAFRVRSASNMVLPLISAQRVPALSTRWPLPIPLIQTEQARRVLVIGSEVTPGFSIGPIAPHVAFGDGAGAVLLDVAGPESESAILSTSPHSDGAYADILYVEREGKDGLSVRNEWQGSLPTCREARGCCG